MGQKPKFHKGGGNHPPALLQLATPTTAYLIRLRYEGMKQGQSVVMTEELVKLLSDPSVPKGCQMKNWEKDLSESMTTYAAADALVALDLLNDLVGE